MLVTGVAFLVVLILVKNFHNKHYKSSFEL